MSAPVLWESFRTRCVAVGVAAALAACGDPSRAPAPVAVDPPAGPGSHAPRASVAPDGRVHLTWYGSGTGGRTELRWATFDGEWSDARLVAAGDDWFVNWADVAGLVEVEGGALYAHLLRRSGAETYDYDATFVRSPDGGRTWSAPERLHADPRPAEHGFVSWAPLGGGRVLATWLDGRETGGHGHGGHGGRGAMTLRARILGGEDGSGPEHLLDDRVCDCCPTDAVRLANGAVLVAYRDRGEDERRDVALVTVGDAPGEPRSVHDDGWIIDGCPVNGPSLARRGPRVALAWFTLGRDDTPRVRVALSEDDAASFGAPLELAGADPIGCVDLAFDAGGALWLAWLERVDSGTGAWCLARVGPDGIGAPTVLASAPPSRAAGLARLEPHGAGLVFAWTEVGDGPDAPSRVRALALAPR